MYGVRVCREKKNMRTVKPQGFCLRTPMIAEFTFVRKTHTFASGTSTYVCIYIYTRFMHCSACVCVCVFVFTHKDFLVIF